MSVRKHIQVMSWVLHARRDAGYISPDRALACSPDLGQGLIQKLKELVEEEFLQVARVFRKADWDRHSTVQQSNGMDKGPKCTRRIHGAQRMFKLQALCSPHLGAPRNMQA